MDLIRLRDELTLIEESLDRSCDLSLSVEDRVVERVIARVHLLEAIKKLNVTIGGKARTDRMPQPTAHAD